MQLKPHIYFQIMRKQSKNLFQNNMNLIKIFCIILFLLTSCNSSENRKLPNEFEAKVIGVKDGDTIEVLYNNKPVVIRFEHIDCPEKKQPFGMKAKQFVSKLIFGKTVKILSKGKTDRWKRLIATIKTLDGVNVNKELVKVGLAMHFKKYSKDKTYDVIELIAKNNKVGMWSQKEVIEPWNYRKMKRKKY